MKSSRIRRNRHKQRLKQWRNKNKDHCIKYNRQYKQRNKDKIKPVQQQYYQKNKDGQD